MTKSQRESIKQKFNALISTGTTGNHFDENNYRIRLINGISLVVALMMATFVAIDSARAAWIEVLSDVITAAAAGSPILLNKGRKFELAQLAAVLFFLIGAISNLILLGSTDMAIIVLVMAGCTSCILLPLHRWKAILSFNFFAISAGIGLILFPFNGISPTLEHEWALTAKMLNLFAIVVFLVGTYLFHNFESTYFLKKINQSLTEMAAINEQAQTNARLASLGEFAAGVAHEINNPLAIIQGTAFQIQRKSESGTIAAEDLKSATDRIISTVDRISKITAGMLTFARKPESEEKQMAIELTPVIHSLVAFFTESVRSRGIKVEVTGLNPTLKVKGQAGWIQQILLNFMTNAEYASQQDATNQASIIALRVHQPDHQTVWIDVSDWGSGISQEIEKKIMEPFFTTKPVGKGTGLGLSISRGLAQSMGGDITIASLRNPTTFRLSLRSFEVAQNAQFNRVPETR